MSVIATVCLLCGMGQYSAHIPWVTGCGGYVGEFIHDDQPHIVCAKINLFFLHFAESFELDGKSCCEKDQVLPENIDRPVERTHLFG